MSETRDVLSRQGGPAVPSLQGWVIYVCPICGHAGATDVCAGPRDHHELISRKSGRVEVVPLADLQIERARLQTEIGRLREALGNLARSLPEASNKQDRYRMSLGIRDVLDGRETP